MTLRAVMLLNEPNNLSHWDFALDPDWSIFAAMCRWAAGAIRATAPHLKLVMGTSMGCMHSWVWGYTYPTFVDGLVPLACAPSPCVASGGVPR